MPLAYPASASSFFARVVGGLPHAHVAEWRPGHVERDEKRTRAVCFYDLRLAAALYRIDGENRDFVDDVHLACHQRGHARCVFGNDLENHAIDPGGPGGWNRRRPAVIIRAGF